VLITFHEFKAAPDAKIVQQNFSFDFSTAERSLRA
jgi:hypothetical protein